jgi:formylglycine-generating enzyme required for sulfatase activity
LRAFIIAISLLLPGIVFANNLSITNVSLVRPNEANKTINIKFDVSWSNSWSDSENYDAVWIFAKYKKTADSNWYHVKLSGIYSFGSGTALIGSVPSDYVGCFLYRSATSNGALSTTNIEIIWDWGMDSNLSASSVIDEIKVFGIEMVYIPQGNFYIGDGDGTEDGYGGSGHSPAAFNSGTNDALPVLIGTTLARNIYASGDIESGIGIGGSGPYAGIDTNNDGTIDNASFPVGWAPFYIMKYEITQGQYADFLSTLTSAQCNNRYNSALYGSSRYTITGTCPNITTNRPDRACNDMGYQDLYAYADWAGLRPVSDTEYEKACRGPNTPVSWEQAWGIQSYTYAMSISGSENGTETVTGPAGANYVEEMDPGYEYSGGDAGYGPLRVGIFATSGSNRVTSGAGYYGAMDLSGNVAEFVVSLSPVSSGRSFQGTHGDGALTGSGAANNSDWPLGDPYMFYHEDMGTGASVSGRASSVSGRSSILGGRCARSAP